MINLNQTAKNNLQDLGKSSFFSHGVVDNDFNLLFQTHFQLGKTTINSGLILSANAHIWGGIYPLIKFGTIQQKRIFSHTFPEANIKAVLPDISL